MSTINWYNAPSGTTHKRICWDVYWYQQSSDNPDDHALVYKNQYEVECINWEIDPLTTNGMLNCSSFTVIPSRIPNWNEAPSSRTQQMEYLIILIE